MRHYYSCEFIRRQYVMTAHKSMNLSSCFSAGSSHTREKCRWGGLPRFPIDSGFIFYAFDVFMARMNGLMGGFESFDPGE